MERSTLVGCRATKKLLVFYGSFKAHAALSSAVCARPKEGSALQISADSAAGQAIYLHRHIHGMTLVRSFIGIILHMPDVLRGT